MCHHFLSTEEIIKVYLHTKEERHAAAADKRRVKTTSVVSVRITKTLLHPSKNSITL